MTPQIPQIIWDSHHTKDTETPQNQQFCCAVCVPPAPHAQIVLISGTSYCTTHAQEALDR